MELAVDSSRSRQFGVLDRKTGLLVKCAWCGRALAHIAEWAEPSRFSFPVPKRFDPPVRIVLFDTGWRPRNDGIWQLTSRGQKQLNRGHVPHIRGVRKAAKSVDKESRGDAVLSFSPDEQEWTRPFWMLGERWRDEIRVQCPGSNCGILVFAENMLRLRMYRDELPPTVFREIPPPDMWGKPDYRLREPDHNHEYTGGDREHAPMVQFRLGGAVPILIGGL